MDATDHVCEWVYLARSLTEDTTHQELQFSGLNISSSFCTTPGKSAPNHFACSCATSTTRFTLCLNTQTQTRLQLPLQNPFSSSNSTDNSSAKT